MFHGWSLNPVHEFCQTPYMQPLNSQHWRMGSTNHIIIFKWRVLYLVNSMNDVNTLDFVKQEQPHRHELKSRKTSSNFPHKSVLVSNSFQTPQNPHKLFQTGPNIFKHIQKKPNASLTNFREILWNFNAQYIDMTWPY